MNTKNKIFVGLSSAIIASSFIIPEVNNNYQFSAQAVDINNSNTLINRNQLTLGKIVNAEGIISSQLGKWGGQGFYLQLNNGQSVYVYPGKNELKGLTLAKGDKVSFTAEVGQYNNALQLVKLKNIKVISSNNATTSHLVTSNQFSQSLLDSNIKLNNLTVANVKSQGSFKSTIITVTDSSGTKVDIFADNRATGDFDVVSKLVTKNTKLSSVTGFLTNFNGKYQIKVANLEDIVVTSSNNEEISAETTENINVPESKVTKVANIGEIQGASHTSPLIGKEVRVENVVVTKLDGKKGFYVQDITPDNNNSTSDAIYVVSKEKVTVGDKINIEGLVNENYGLGYAEKTKTDLTITQLVANKIEKNGKNPLPNPIVLGDNIPKNNIEDDAFAKFEPTIDALDFWESIEGMLVKVPKPQILGPQKYGNLYVLPEGYQGERNNANGISLRPDGYNTEVIPLLISNKNYVAKANDSLADSVIGNVTYDYSEYKVDLRGNQLPKKIDGKLKREESTIQFDENKLTVASYNIENFSANYSAKETPEEKVEKIANSFIKEINKPDVITLIEVQDNNGSVDDGTTSGVESGERLAKKISELGGPQYKYIEIAPQNNADGGKPGANIRVAFLYNPERVTLPNKEIANSNEAAKFLNGQLEKNPARIAPSSPAFTNVRKSLAVEFEFKGEKVIIIANHLKSKNGDNPLFGKTQPALETSKASRIEQAKELNKFVKEGLAQNPNLKFVLTGDFNDFEFSETVKAVEGEELVNLLSNHEKTDRYSYFYRGNNQSLDNIFVSKNLLENIKFDAVHVNSSFMEEHGRASDHDPLIVQLDFTKFIKKETNNTIMNDTPSESEVPTTKVPSDTPVVELPNENIEVVPNDAPIYEALPNENIGVGNSDSPSADLANDSIEVLANDNDVTKSPEVNKVEVINQDIETNSDNTSTYENIKTYNIVDTVSNNAQKYEKQIDQTLNKKLGNTGLTVANASMFGVATLILAAFLLRRKTKK